MLLFSRKEPLFVAAGRDFGWQPLVATMVADE